MTAKLIGGGLIMLASLLYGRMKIAEERKKSALAEGTVEFVRAVRDNISHYKKPLSEIFDSVRIDALERCGFLPACRSDGIRAAWETGTLKLPGKMSEIMCAFAERIGSGYREDELELCGYTLTQLEKHAEGVRTERENREKLYRNIPPLAALSAVLLVL